MAEPTRPPLFTRPFVALAIADLAYFTAAGVAIFVLPLTVTGPLGLDEAAAGIAFGAFAFSALVLRPVVGRMSDRIGRRPLLIGGAAVVASCLALTAAVDELGAIIALRLVAGVGEAAFMVAGFAALADLAPPERRGEALSFNSLGLYVGLGLGPLLGTAFLQLGGHATAWIGTGALVAVAGAVVLLVGETLVTPADAGARSAFIHRPSLPIALGYLASVAAVGGLLAFTSLHATRIGLETPSIALVVYGAVVIACRVLFARLPDRVPALPLGAASLIAVAAGLAIAAAWPHPVGFLVGVATAAVGVAFTTPAFFSAALALASPAERGIASGTVTAAIDLGLGLGPILLGVVAASHGIPWAFAGGATMAIAGALWTFRIARAPIHGPASR